MHLVHPFTGLSSSIHTCPILSSVRGMVAKQLRLDAAAPADSACYCQAGAHALHGKCWSLFPTLCRSIVSCITMADAPSQLT